MTVLNNPTSTPVCTRFWNYVKTDLTQDLKRKVIVAGIGALWSAAWGAAKAINDHRDKYSSSLNTAAIACIVVGTLPTAYYLAKAVANACGNLCNDCMVSRNIREQERVYARL